MIAIKRQERALQRGLDLQAINTVQLLTCKGNLEALEAVEFRTTGLGFMEQESAGNDSDDGRVPMKDDVEQDINDHKENVKVTPSSKKDRQGRENTAGAGRNAGHITMGSVKIFSEAGDLHLTDESEEDPDECVDSELEDMVVFGEHVRKTKTTTLLKNLELEDSEEDSEDDDDVSQLFDVMEDALFTPDKIPGTGKQKIGSIGKSLEPAMWPTSVHKTTKKAKKVPGQKKRERKEMIAIKRQERALQRGLDLQAINTALEGIVERGTDIYAFAPMEDRDRAQIHKMAAMYRLKSASQGSGKKRFTVVTRTKHTGLPTGADKYRLAAMLDREGNSVIPLTGEDRRMAKKFKNAARQAFLTMQTPTPKGKKKKNFMQGEPLLRKSKSKKAATSAEKSGAKKLRTPKYANNPMSFISCGTMVTENDATTTVVQIGQASSSSSKVAATYTTIGTFEAHTKGFGSRIMSRMGFVEGGGLGRDGQGINSPLEAVKRPKSLGLGAYAPPPPPSA